MEVLADFVNIDNDTPAFNEWFDVYENILACDINEQNNNNDDSNFRSSDILPKITEPMKSTEKLLY
jgi:hypothetical protein